MPNRFGDSPAYFSTDKGSRSRQETVGGRKRYGKEYDRIFGKRKIKVMKKIDA